MHGCTGFGRISVFIATPKFPELLVEAASTPRTNCLANASCTLPGTNLVMAGTDYFRIPKIIQNRHIAVSGNCMPYKIMART
jgi:hypothetical protein